MLPVTGTRRIGWAALPSGVRARIEGRLGSPVVHAGSQPGGFSAGLAAFHRREIATLPPLVAVPAVSVVPGR